MIQQLFCHSDHTNHQKANIHFGPYSQIQDKGCCIRTSSKSPTAQGRTSNAHDKRFA